MTRMLLLAVLIVSTTFTSMGNAQDEEKEPQRLNYYRSHPDFGDSFVLFPERMVKFGDIPEGQAFVVINISHLAIPSHMIDGERWIMAEPEKGNVAITEMRKTFIELKINEKLSKESREHLEETGGLTYFKSKIAYVASIKPEVADEIWNILEGMRTDGEVLKMGMKKLSEK